MKRTQLISVMVAVSTLLAPGTKFVNSVDAQTQSSSVPALDIQTKEMTISIAYPSTWSVGPQRFRNGYQLFSVPAPYLATADRSTLAQMLVTYEKYPNHTEALRQLRSIAAEETATVTYLNIGGWPAIQRRFFARVGQPGGKDIEVPLEELRVTTAIAADSQLIRLETRIPLVASTSVADDAQAIGQAIAFSVTGDPATVAQELNDLQTRQPSAPQITPAGPESYTPPTQSSPSSNASPGLVPLSSTAPESAGLAVTAYPGRGEIETAASSDGRSIVIAGNGGAAVSGNAGQTFTNAANPGLNDSSLAVGVSGAFYMANIGSAPGSNTTAISRSTNGGSNFVFVANATACSTNGPGCTLPDQEHIAADRFNIAPGGGDQVYSVWRLCNPGCVGALVTFSTNSGASWSAPITVDGGGDFPRITVGQDGFVYVVYAIGNSRDGIRIKKYSSAANGFALQSTFDVVGTGNSNVPCPVPGLDRCNDGNVLASPMAAVDDTNPNHVYVAYANNTVAGNEDVFVRDSTDGGATFPGGRVVRLNQALPARRYMPWVSAVGGAARVSWYDRRASAGSLDNSLADFYSGSAFLDAANNVVAGPEFRVSPVSDSNCGSGWPCAPRSMNDSESCSLQPQFAGTCASTNTKCDFSTPTNCMAVACQTGGGCPKYGDYNGIAAAAGRVFNAWESATNPQGVRDGFTVYFAGKIVCCVPQIQVPGSVSFPDSCSGTTNFATLLVCNTGKEDLEVDGIGSSNPRFAVTTPSSGYPVIISPDFCFPFQVRFSPGGAPGLNSATLTITNNDSVNPVVSVLAMGSQIDAAMQLVMADGGRFGNVCSNSFKDLDLTINNSGGCDLLVTNITLSDPEFKAPTVIGYPLVVQGGTSIHVPIRLEPDSLGMKSANITVLARSATGGTGFIRMFSVSGNTPPGDVRVTGSTDFGDVCAGVLAEKQLSVCNVGTCNLNVSSVAFDPPCVHFTLINNPFPAAVSPDSCQDVTVRYTPTNCGPHSCTLKITTDDPDTPVIIKTVTANTPCPMIDVPPDQCFPPTVIQSVGACSSLKPFPVSNTGTCPLRITAITLGGANPNAYFLSGLPSFPIILEQGHVVGEGNFKIGFAPLLLARDTLATISVTYEDDPITHHTTTVTRTLNGEGVRTGARVLVLVNGSVADNVEKLQIQRINANRNKNLLDTVETIQDLPPVTFVPAAPCPAFTYHREYSTVDNPIQLLPGSYQITATALVNGKRKSKSIGFDVQTCTFNPNIVISLP
jgi:HYDIN/CFA65/VesB-like, Ig-like domain